MPTNQMLVDFNKLIEALEKFIPEILSKNQKVDVKELAQEMAKTLQKMSEQSGNPLTVDKLADPQFIHQISTAIKLTATIKTTPALAAGLNNVMQTLTGDLANKLGKDKFDQFIDELKKLIKENKHDKLKMRDAFKALLSKHLTPAEHGKLVTQLDKFMNDMKKLTPDMAAPKKTQVDDPYVNLLGVLNSAFTGGHAVPQTQDMGNALAIPDMNPFNDNANIGKDNSINFCWGDSFGKEGKSIDRMEAIGSIFVEIMKEAGIPTHQAKSPYATTPSPLPDK